VGSFKLNSYLGNYMDELYLTKLQKDVNLEELKDSLNDEAIYYDSLVYAEIIPTEGKYLVYIYPFINEDDTLVDIKSRILNGSKLASEGTKEYYMWALKSIDSKLDEAYKEDVNVEIYLRKEKETLIGKTDFDVLTLYID
jgi:hypothetical protein